MTDLLQATIEAAGFKPQPNSPMSRKSDPRGAEYGHFDAFIAGDHIAVSHDSPDSLATGEYHYTMHFYHMRDFATWASDCT